MAYGYKTTLEVFENTYDVSVCSYEFNRDIDDNGDIDSPVQGGVINLAIEDAPVDNNLYKWAMKHKHTDGCIRMQQIGDMDSVVEEGLTFCEAFCVNMKMNYQRDSIASGHFSIMMTIVAHSMYLGGQEITRDKWENI